MAAAEVPGAAAVAVATEEVLRWTTPLNHFRRTATTDTVLADQKIAAGDKVVIWYPSGNRDESVFPDPDRFDVSRDPNPQLSFGRGGPHRCIGEHLARLEVQITLEELLRRVEHFDRAGDPSRVRSNFVHGLKRLPVTAVR